MNILMELLIVNFKMMLYTVFGVICLAIIIYVTNKYDLLKYDPGKDEQENRLKFKLLNPQIMNSDKLLLYKKFGSYRKCNINHYDYATFKYLYLGFETEFLAIGLNNKLKKY